jgi:hypothetical protein
MQVRKALLEDVETIVFIEESALQTSLGMPFFRQEFLTNPFANYYLIEDQGVFVFF